MRNLKRQIARDRLSIMGVGNVNRKLSQKRDGVPLWRAVLQGDFGQKAERAQMNYGKLLKAKKHERKLA